MGKVYDTVYFPQSLAGTRIRRPGRYHRTNYETGKAEMKHLLEDTQERIHSSVRARIDLAGRAIEPDWNQVFPRGLSIFPLIVHYLRWITGRHHSTYLPQRKYGPLFGWKLGDGHKSHLDPNMEIDMSPEGHRDIGWVYEGNEACVNKSMPEDKLGPYELKLLEKDQHFADQIMFSNNAWRWFKKKPKHSPRHSHTF